MPKKHRQYHLIRKYVTYENLCPASTLRASPLLASSIKSASLTDETRATSTLPTFGKRQVPWV